MSEIDEPNPSQVFLVRVWLEQLGAGKTEWRGKIQHIGNSETRYFRDWQTLSGHLHAMLPDATCALAGQRKSAV